MPRIRIRSLLILIALAALLMAVVAMALRQPTRPYSTVFAQFDPAALLAARPGCSVEAVGGRGGGTFHMRLGDAEKEWSGFVAAPNDPSIRQTIQKAIEGYIEKESRGRFHTEGNLAGDEHETPLYARLPSHAVFSFNEGEWHGDMHVWLFPDSSGSGVGYVIFLREKRIE